MSHLSEGEIERFLKARAAPWERQRVVRHLLAGCGVCRRKVVEQAPGRLFDKAGERTAGGERPGTRSVRGSDRPGPETTL